MAHVWPLLLPFLPLPSRPSNLYSRFPCLHLSSLFPPPFVRSSPWLRGSNPERVFAAIPEPVEKPVTYSLLILALSRPLVVNVQSSMRRVAFGHALCENARDTSSANNFRTFCFLFSFFSFASIRKDSAFFAWPPSGSRRKPPNEIFAFGQCIALTT